VDRIEDGELAVLLVGEDETELVVRHSELPSGSEVGSVLFVTVEDGKLVSARLDESDTEATRQRVEDKLRQLRDRGRRL
jgi:hypothetical protein